MARSLTIQQEETASTTPLLTGFLLLAVSLLLLGTLFGSFTATSAPADAPTQTVTP